MVVNYNISLTWIKAIWGWFPLLAMIPVRSQWGRYNLPRYVICIYILHIDFYSTLFPGYPLEKLNMLRTDKSPSWNRKKSSCLSCLVSGIPTPLKNMSSSVGIIISNIWKNKSHVPNHQPNIHIYIYKVVPPSDVCWFIIPLTIDISAISPNVK